jgi:hypothetical protein
MGTPSPLLIMKKKPQHRIEQEIVETTSAYKKTWNFIKSLVGDKGFEFDISEVRKKFNIPPKGFKDILYVKIKGEKYIKTPPSLAEQPFRPDILELAQKYGLDFMWADVIEHYAVYNDLQITTMGSTFETIDLAHSLSGPEEMEYEGEKWLDDGNYEYIKERSKTHPVAILLSPYASQRDILDYVKKLYNISIKPALQRHQDPKIKIGKVRTKSYVVDVRNKFIYENRNLPKKKIVELIAKHFRDVLDYTYIAKIIKDEGRKRSEHG